MASPIKAGDIFTNARALLNDALADVYTDDVLIPYLKMAIVDLRLECADNNIPYTNTTSEAITIEAGVTGIGGPGQPALPSDLIEIVEMYERIDGTSNDYMLMTRRRFEPKTGVQTTYLQVYTWQNQRVHFIGSTSDIQVKIDYISQNIGDVIDKNSLILIYNSCAFLWYRTAALAAFYIMENKTRSDECNSEAGRCIESMEAIAQRGEQSMPVRRRPFMSSYRRGGWAGSGR